MRKKVLISVYLYWKALGIASFGNKLCKEEILIIETVKQSFFYKKKNE